MEDNIKRREENLNKFWAHMETEKRYAVDYTNPVKWHDEMLAKVPWKVTHNAPLRIGR